MAKRKIKILVTGGAGCIGVAVCNLLIQKNYKVHLFDLADQIEISKKLINKNIKIFEGSVLDKTSLLKASKGCEVVIHLAASLGVKNTEENLYRCFQINVKGTENVLDICLQKKIKRIIFSSSSEVYGEPLKNPIKEDAKTYGKSFYAVTKLMGENMIRAYSQLDKKLEFVILRFFNTYGVNQVAQFVIPKFIFLAKKKKAIIINGDGNQKRSYCHASDTAIGVEKCIKNKKVKNETLNLGNGKQLVTLKKLVNMINKKVGKNSKVIFNKKFYKTDRTVDREIFNRYCDSRKAEKLLNFKPKINLSKGLDDLIKFNIRHNWPNI